MRHFLLFLVCIPILCLFGCSNSNYDAIKEGEPFVATVNLIDRSIQFIDSERNTIALWTFNEAITGAELIGEDLLLVYGHQMPYVKWISLSSGEVINEQDVALGITNAYYDRFEEIVYVTNNKTNRVYAYSTDGKLLYDVAVKNYPMSITVDEKYVYVVNYKDTILSVIEKETHQVVNEWAIPKSSHGLYLANDQLWIGGHGEGKEANRYIRIYDNATGQQLKSIELPVMPIAVTDINEKIIVVSHGNSMLHALNQNDEVIWEKQVGANPFAIAAFNGEVVVAGYDDHTLYFLSEEGDELQSVQVGKGPFQLIVRR